MTNKTRQMEIAVKSLLVAIILCFIYVMIKLSEDVGYEKGYQDCKVMSVNPYDFDNGVK